MEGLSGILKRGKGGYYRLHCEWVQGGEASTGVDSNR